MIEGILEASPLYSELFFIIALLVISGLVLLLIRYYLPLRKTPAYLLIPIFFALVLPASIILLVPIDLASIATDSNIRESRGIWLPKRVILVSWRILYWETFFLTWFILPILGEYADTGYRDPKSRLIWSLKRNLVYQGVVFGSGLAVMIYFFISAGVSFTTLKGLLVATAYFWSLLFAIYLMGHGLVAIPRRFFRCANLSSRLEYLYSNAAKLDERLVDSIFELEDLEELVNELAGRKSTMDPKFQDWIEELIDEYQFMNIRPRYPPAQRVSSSEIILPRIITEKFIADLSRTLSIAHHAHARYLEEWNQVVISAAEIKETLDAYSLGRIEIGKSSPHATLLERFTIFTPRTRFYFRYYLLPCLNRFLGLFFSLASFFIIWSELIKPINPLFSIISVTVIHHPNSEYGEIGFAGQIVAASWILYMCLAALTSLTEVRVWQGHALVHRNTRGGSAVWYSYQVARLSVPLAFNFITFLDPGLYTRTVFYEFLGNLINLTPLSSWFDLLWPTFIIFPVCATLFGLYRKVHDCIGYGDLIDDEERNSDTAYGTASRSRGKDLIERELQSSSPTRLERDSSSNRRQAKRVSTNSPRTTLFSTIPEGRQTLGPTPQLRSSSDNQPRPGGLLGENSYQTFWHRLKNTVETVQSPNWLDNVGDSIKISKWISGNNRSGSDRNKATGWLNGLRQEGRVRL
ncbi:LMBR1 domain-containing protein 2 [Erysiphe neolycopersici]|uniref:LMBR1 domain-containing protein 2 n=1 Tax=Erysiphe neolycopersici TaxID=212602 RepID=A0A420HEN7_9PEZI|nr:LMBR1 domain-containing protein 2 [Erysiphe neolycopersici]